MKNNMFNKSRLKFNELYSDAIDYLKTVYGKVGDYFTNASPMGQLLRVLLHIGRMIMFYIEDSITELNINTASRERSIRGIATLTGHNPSRGMSARGTININYNNNSEYLNQTVIIPNFTQITNEGNGLKYIMLLPSEHMKVNLNNGLVFNNISIIQGEIKYQQATGNGYALQSINFPLKQNTGLIDQYFCNIYVNGEKWRNVESILDMGIMEKACMIKTGLNGGVDVFFGNETNGLIPEVGATILFEYIQSQGAEGNIDLISQNSNNFWKFESKGYLSDGTTIDLNDVLNISTEHQVLFGTNAEELEMTRLLAPHASRSFVLATAENYKYFLRKLNIFSIIDAIQGFNTYDDIKARYEYNTAYAELTTLNNNYIQEKELTGANSQKSQELYKKIIEQKNKVEKCKTKYEETKLDDNTVYLFLVPDITKRMGETNNYFTCSLDTFNLTSDEIIGIKQLIESSGQQMITTDVEVIQPKTPKFAINCFIQMWDGYEFESVKSEIIDNISTYLIKNTRRDRIPISDLIKVVEDVKGVDSVTIAFDADKNNSYIYGENNYGIDDFGDIILSRYINDVNNNQIEIKDILPLFRGDFISMNGVEYGDDIYDGLSPINITLRGLSYNKTSQANTNII